MQEESIRSRIKREHEAYTSWRNAVSDFTKHASSLSEWTSIPPYFQDRIGEEVDKVAVRIPPGLRDNKSAAAFELINAMILHVREVYPNIWLTRHGRYLGFCRLLHDHVVTIWTGIEIDENLINIHVMHGIVHVRQGHVVDPLTFDPPAPPQCPNTVTQRLLFLYGLLQAYTPYVFSMTPAIMLAGYAVIADACPLWLLLALALAFCTSAAWRFQATHPDIDWIGNGMAFAFFGGLSVIGVLSQTNPVIAQEKLVRLSQVFLATPGLSLAGSIVSTILLSFVIHECVLLVKGKYQVFYHEYLVRPHDESAAKYDALCKTEHDKFLSNLQDRSFKLVPQENVHEVFTKSLDHRIFSQCLIEVLHKVKSVFENN